MNTATAQAVQPAACMVAADHAVTSRNAPTGVVSNWRAEAIQRAAQAADRYGDEYAMTGCFASLGAMHRADALLRRLLGA